MTWYTYDNKDHMQPTPFSKAMTLDIYMLMSIRLLWQRPVPLQHPLALISDERGSS